MEVAREDISLLEALREDLGVRAVKDGCSPQGQCGCCTVLVDGSARVACVTPLRRVVGRAVTTVDGLPAEQRDWLVASFVAHGASQCGFCTPGIVCRLAALGSGPPAPRPAARVESALLAHLCRCTGWRSIVAAATSPGAAASGSGAAVSVGASARATIEGGTPQRTGDDMVLGRGGFADDHPPPGCLVAVPVAGGDPASVEGWALGETLAAARAGAGNVQGRRSGQALAYPVDVPPGEWDITLQTTWVEPAYLEPDASWCEPGGPPASPVANGGAFGGKLGSVAPGAARMLADHLDQPVRVLLSREDVVRLGPKRPPVGAGVRLDGTGVLRLGASVDLVRTATAIGAFRTQSTEAAPRIAVEAVPVVGPAVSADIRAAGWAEAAILDAVAAAVSGGVRDVTVSTVEGAAASAVVELDASGWPAGVHVEAQAGDPLDETVLRSYVQGAAHMALGWVLSEGIAVDADGRPTDLTIRSFGILRAKDTPPIEVIVAPATGPAVKVSDAVFAAVAAAAWLAQGLPSRWPTMRGTRR